MIPRIIDLSARNGLAVLTLVFAAVRYGWWSLNHLALDAIPDLSDTQVIVYSRRDRSKEGVAGKVAPSQPSEVLIVGAYPLKWLAIAISTIARHGKLGRKRVRRLRRALFAPGGMPTPFNRAAVCISSWTKLGDPLRKGMWLGLVIGTALLLQGCCSASPAVGPNLNITKAAGNQNEPAVAINPNDNDRIFVVSRNELGGLYTARSSDGGVTWTSQPIARMTLPAAGDIPRAYGNASAAWDTFGNLFLAYLSQSSATIGTYVSLAVSKDGGATFYSPTGTGAVLMLPVNPPGTPVIGDQPTVTVGPGSAGFPGSVWVTYWTMGGIAVSGAGVSGLGVVGPFTSMQPVQPASVNFGDIAVGPNGEVMVTYGPNFGSSGKIFINVKPDGLGPNPFSTFTAAAPVNIGGFAHIPAHPNWGIDPEAGLAWDCSTGPHHGRVYLVYTDAPEVASADTDIFVIHSDDMGTAWSIPVRVNDDTGTNTQFLPRVSLDQSDGMIAVTWYDARNSAGNDTAEYFGAFSGDGGATFGASFQIAAGTSDQARNLTSSKKTDYGDYTGNAFVNGRLVPAWADNSNSTGDNPDGATNFDVYAAIVQAPALQVICCPANALATFVNKCRLDVRQSGAGSVMHEPDQEPGSGKKGLVLAALGIGPAGPAQVQTAIFDFDSSALSLTTGRNTPFDRTSGGAPARFSSPSGLAGSIQSAQVVLALRGSGIRGRGSLAAVTVRMGSLDAPVQYAGAQPRFASLDQVNALVPRALAGQGEVDLALTADGRAAITVRVNIK